MTTKQTQTAAEEIRFQEEPVSVLCVDDNEHLADALKLKFQHMGGFEWKGWLPSADALLSTVQRLRPRLLILDIDMPRGSPFEALAELAEQCPETRTVMFSGHVSLELINRALEAGAWGYVSKNDGEDALIKALREVLSGELGLSQEVRVAYGHRA